MQVRLFFGLAVSLGHALVLMCMLNTPPAQPRLTSAQAVVVRFDRSAAPTSVNVNTEQALKPATEIPLVDQPRLSEAPASTSDIPLATPTTEVSRPVDAGPPPVETAPTPPQPTNTAAATTYPPKTVSISDVQYARAPSRDYPRAALLRGEEGRVSMKVLVGQDGKPEAVHITRSSGYEALDRAAVQSIKTSIFKPYTEDGIPRSVWVHTTLEYYLESAT